MKKSAHSKIEIREKPPRLAMRMRPLRLRKTSEVLCNNLGK
jgi:hypothetical protein